jgi:transposase InsO family protein
VEFARRLCDEGAKCREVAALLEVPEVTLRTWRRRRQDPAGPAALRGRPCKNAAPERRNAVLEALAERGPHAGVPWLKETFPDVARGELVELKTLDRERRRAEQARHARRLQWKRTGAVWAIDYTEPPEPIDGRYAAAVSVRDLASGFELAWRPVAPTADAAIAVLTTLFRDYGPPLVLKSDNGGPFTAHATRALLDEWAVTPLYSPPYTPGYNGSCEAGIGGLKSRTRHLAAYDGAGDAWTVAHLDAARRIANREHHPRRLHGRTAAEVWSDRVPISEDERRRFRDAVTRIRRPLVKALQSAFYEALNAADRASLDRQAVPAALIEMRILSILRSVITPTINSI